MNTDPSNFIRSGNKFEVVIMNEGLYEITFGVYGCKSPQIEICLNDEVISSSQKMLNPKLDKLENRHSDGNVVGLTILDYFMFPFNSWIWVNFKGDVGYQGFI